MGVDVDGSLHIARWVMPLVIGLLLFLPGPCVTGTGLCPEDAAECGGESTTTCYSVVGIPTNAAVAALGVPVVVLAATAARKLVAGKRSRGATPA